MKTIRRADRFDAQLNREELHQLFTRYAEQDTAAWHEGMHVSLSPDDVAFIDAYRKQHPENAMMKHDQAERRD